MARGTIIIDQERCKGCELCAQVCPKEVVEMATDMLNSRGYRPATLADPDGECTGCAICAMICPDVCITVYREVRKKAHAPAHATP